MNNTITVTSNGRVATFSQNELLVAHCQDELRIRIVETLAAEWGYKLVDALSFTGQLGCGFPLHAQGNYPRIPVTATGIRVSQFFTISSCVLSVSSRCPRNHGLRSPGHRRARRSSFGHGYP